MLNLASTCKGGVVIIDDGTASIGSHTNGGLMKHFTDHLHSSTVSGGQRCPEAMLAMYTNQEPDVIKEEAVLSRVLTIHFPNVIVGSKRVWPGAVCRF